MAPEPAKRWRVVIHGLLETARHQLLCQSVICGQGCHFHDRIYILRGTHVHHLHVIDQQACDTAADEYHLITQRTHGLGYGN